MKFLLDAHLPSSLCGVIRAAGHEADHVSGLPGGNRTPDRVINRMAAQESYVVVSKDSDFYYSHVVQGAPPKLVLVRVGNMRARDLKGLIERNLPEIVAALSMHTLIEIDHSTVRIVMEDPVAAPLPTVRRRPTVRP
jgi:predicted nuclease of predicted toxin-antitoxin system